MPAVKADARFWAKVDKSGDCWLWTGAKTHGYGHLNRYRDGRQVHLRAHRVSWEEHYGAIPDGMCVCHRCDNPSCVRPDHLFLGTQDENLADMRGKGRGSAPPRVRRPRLTEEQAREIIAAKAGGLPIAPFHRKFGVARSTVYAVAYGVNWRHLGA